MSTHKPYLLLLLCIAPAAARAADPVHSVFESGGRSYAVYVKNQRGLLLSATAQSELIREQRAPLPDCAALNRTMSAWSSSIQDCRDGSQAACKSLQTLVEALRTNEDVLGGSLQQSWSIGPEFPAPEEPDQAVRAEAARLTGLEESHMAYHPGGTATGSPSTATVSVAPEGQSAASRLAGFISYKPVTFSRTLKAFVTTDNILTCGLLDGDVKLLWTQDGTVSVGARPGALSAAQLWDIYQQVQSMGAITGTTPALRAFHMGSRIGAVLKNARIPLDNLEEKINLVIDALFSASTLELRADITREQLESQLGNGVDFQISMPWKSVGTR